MRLSGAAGASLGGWFGSVPDGGGGSQICSFIRVFSVYVHMDWGRRSGVTAAKRVLDLIREDIQAWLAAG